MATIFVIVTLTYRCINLTNNEIFSRLNYEKSPVEVCKIAMDKYEQTHWYFIVHNELTLLIGLWK
jgi:hypothetical protein